MYAPTGYQVGYNVAGYNTAGHAVPGYDPAGSYTAYPAVSYEVGDDDVQEEDHGNRRKTMRERVLPKIRAVRAFDSIVSSSESEEEVEEESHAERRAKILALKAIQRSKDSSSMQRTMMEYIMEDWLPGNELSGNIYRVWAFGSLKRPRCSCKTEVMMRNAKWLGSLSIFAIQCIGPIFLWMSLSWSWGVEEKDAVDWSKWYSTSTLSTGNFQHWEGNACTKTLSTLFIFAFNLNGMYLISHEADNGKNLSKVWNYLRCDEKEHMCKIMLKIGMFINCYMVLMCSASIPLIMFNDQDPKSVLMDSLAIIFLYNLDDIGSDLGFINEDDWPAVRMKWISTHDQVKTFEGHDMSSVFVYDFTIFLAGLQCILVPLFFVITNWEGMKPG